MRQYISELMPLIVEALLDGAAATKREVAVVTLGQVVQSTGYVACLFCHFEMNVNIVLGLCVKVLMWMVLFSVRCSMIAIAVMFPISFSFSWRLSYSPLMCCALFID